jgi:formylglycine-generating enzyme
MAQVGAFCIDRYEAHLVTRGPDGLERPWPHQLRPESGGYYESRSEAGAFPQGYVSRHEASSACANAGKRLCTLVEWRRACQGAHATTYPFGASPRQGACNTGKLHLVTKWHGTDASAWTFENFNSPRLNLEPGFLAKGGEYEACRSEDGVYDLVGNLHEWVSDPVPSALVTRAPDENGAYPPQSVRPGNGIFVGGFFSTTNQNGEGCAYVTLTHEPAYHDYSTGFRCCAEPPPSP